MSTADELNEELKATAAAYNGANPTGDSAEDAAAQKAAHELNKVQGSTGHNGNPEVLGETPEEAAAHAAKKAADAAAAVEAVKTPEEKAAEAKAATEAADAAAKVIADKAAADAAELAKKKAAETPEETAEREAAEKKKAESDKQWMTTDSKEFNASLNLMKAAGMTAEKAAELFDGAAQTGDLSKVDQAALIAEVGEDNATLIMAGFTSYVETDGTAVLERLKTVQDSVGGSDNWATMTKWAKAKAKGDDTFRGSIESITGMLNSDDPLQSKLAATEFLSMYNADVTNSTLTSTETVDVLNKATVPATPATTPMTAREYADGVGEAQRGLRGAEQAARLKELSANRAAGRSKGI